MISGLRCSLRAVRYALFATRTRNFGTPFAVIQVHMDWFDAFDEVFASVERFVATHGRKPREVSVSPMLFTWLAELQRESAMLEGMEVSDPVVIDTPFGEVPLAIDEKLGDFEIVVE